MSEGGREGGREEVKGGDGKVWEVQRVRSVEGEEGGVGGSRNESK